MNTKSLGIVTVVAAMMMSPLSLWADNTAADSMEHPMTTLHEHEVASDQKDQTVTNEEMKAKKNLLEQSKKNYEDSLSKLGADNPATKDAKSQYMSAKKEYKKLVKKDRKGEAELNEDKAKVQEDKATQ